MMPDDAALAAERNLLQGSIEDLRGIEREYRSRLRLYFENHLAELDGEGTAYQLRVATLRLAGAPDGELREVLAELPERQRQRLTTALLRVPVPEVTS